MAFKIKLSTDDAKKIAKECNDKWDKNGMPKSK